MNEDTDRSGPRLGYYVALAVMAATLIAAGLVAANPPNAGVGNVALGVIGSLLASIVFAVLSEYADTPQSRLARNLAGSLAAIRAIEDEARERLQAGVVGVSDKRDHKPDYWFSILDSARDRLDMVGNSLSGWVQGEFRSRLKGTVGRILRDGGQVRIVFMDPYGPLAQAKTALLGKDYKSHIEDFVNLLGELLEEFPESFDSDRLAIHLAKDDLTYMMIDSGRDLYVSPYMSATRAGHPLVVQIEGSSRYAEGYRTDFEKIFARARKANA